MKKTEKSKNFYCILCVAPAVVAILLFSYRPLFQLLKFSFSDWNLLSDTYKNVGLDNYKWLLYGSGSRYLKNAAKVTILYAVAETTATVILGLLFALLFKKASKFFSILRLFVFMPRYISMSCAAIIFMWILNTDHGILNQLLHSMNIDTIDWLGERIPAFVSIVSVSAWRNIGYGMMIYLTVMAGIPRMYYEAAALDGANEFHSFFHITFPELIPSVFFLATTSFLSAVKAFQHIEIMTEGGPMRSTEVIVYLIYKYALVDFRINRASAVAVILFILLFILTLTVFLISEKFHQEENMR